MFFRPERAEYISPGQRPGEGNAKFYRPRTKVEKSSSQVSDGMGLTIENRN
jgi:hypothetical protein